MCQCSKFRRAGLARRRFLASAAAAAVSGVLASPAGALVAPSREASVRDLVRFVDHIALVRQPSDDAPVEPGWVRKWSGPVNVRLTGVTAPGLARTLERSLADISRWSGLSLRLVDAGAPASEAIVIEVWPHAEIAQGFGAAGDVCMCETHGYGGRLQTGRIDVSARFTDCLAHELMHAIGFDNHWLGAGVAGTVRSALGPRHSPWRAAGFSRWDEIAVRTLYDHRLAPGMPREQALPIVREILATLLRA